MLQVRREQTPFICLTADAVRGARDRYLAQGFADYLSKPIDSQKLEMMLMKYLPKDKVVVNREERRTIDEHQESGKEAGIALIVLSRFISHSSL